MTPARKNLLITGNPGVGKTALITKLAERLQLRHPAGFYTAEIRQGGIRKGFEILSLDGKKGLLSHVDLKSSFRVGKYGVDIPGFDRFLDAIAFFSPDTGAVIIDEIGKMESFSDKFQLLVRKILAADKPVAATIAMRGAGFIAEIKKREDVVSFEVTPANRELLLEEIARRCT